MTKSDLNDINKLCQYVYMIGSILGSISVSGQRPTYPSPNPTFILTCYQLTVVGLGEG